MSIATTPATWLTHPEQYRNTQARTGQTLPYSSLLLSILTRRERTNHLPHLTPEKAASLYTDYLQGNLAEIQLAWEQMEDYDPTLSTCLHARQSALAEMTWRIEPDRELLAENNTLAPLAEQQRTLLASRLRAVDNLEDSLTHLGMADFRGVAALEITGSPSRQKWCIIEPWHLVRPIRRGPWYFNKNADPVCQNPESFLQDRVIIRESRPINLAAMFLVLSKTHALQGWDGFLDIYGLPSVFAELPASIPAEQAAEFDAVVRRIVGDGRGTVPSGTKFQTVETTKDNAQAFEQRAKWCDDALIKLALGGLLTVQAESGSGTLAGSAHSDSFARLCAASARSISRAVDTQYCRPILRHAFPGQPILVHFTFGDKQQEDHAANAALLATARTAGWQPDAATASTLLGFQATPAPEPSSDLQGTNDNVPFVNNAAPAGRGELANSTSPQPRRSLGEDGYLVNRKSEDSADNQQLSPAELAAFQSLAASTLNPAAITTAAATAEQALAKALQQAGTTIANTEQDGECGNHQEGKPCRIHDKHPADWVPLQEPERITAEEARKLLASGQTETDPLGRIVKLDNRMIEHWEENAKSREDINHRLSQLPLMRALINKPAEIWKNGDRLTYLASAIGIDGKKYIVGFSPTGKDDYLETFWPDSKSLGSKRKGDKIYPKTAVAPST